MIMILIELVVEPFILVTITIKEFLRMAIKVNAIVGLKEAFAQEKFLICSIQWF